MTGESVQISQASKKNFQTGTKGMLPSARQRRELNLSAGNSSKDKAEEITEHANNNLRYCDLKGDNKVCRSTVFFFLIKSYSCKEMQTTLRRWRSKESDAPCPIFKCPVTRQCLKQFRFAVLKKPAWSSIQVRRILSRVCTVTYCFPCSIYRDDSHVWTNLTKLRYISHQVF